MVHSELLSINTVAKKLRLSVHQLRRWELLFGLEIRRGKGQQRQYRAEDLCALERIRELVDQGWPTSQICQQLEIEGLIAPKLIGLPSPARNSEALIESIIGVRSFCERRLAEITQQLSEIQQILISFSLKQQVADDAYSPWQSVSTGKSERVSELTELLASPVAAVDLELPHVGTNSAASGDKSLPEITDQNYLTVLGKTLDLTGWSDNQADEYSLKNFNVPVWIDLGRSDAEKFLGYLQAVSGFSQAYVQPVDLAAS